MAKVKVRLHHYSHVKGAEGTPGDELEVEKDQAETWETTGGCTILADEAEAKPAPAARPTRPAKTDDK